MNIEHEFLKNEDRCNWHEKSDFESVGGSGISNIATTNARLVVGGPLRSEVFSELSRILDLMVSFDWE